MSRLKRPKTLDGFTKTLEVEDRSDHDGSVSGRSGSKDMSEYALKFWIRQCLEIVKDFVKNGIRLNTLYAPAELLGP